MSGEPVQGTSSKSFAEAAREAFGQIEGDQGKEGLKEANVTRLWMSGGGVVGDEFHVELTPVEPGGSAGSGSY